MRIPGDVESRDDASARVVGTMVYMSPEQIRGQDLDGRSDLFSLGLVLYELATGTRPFARSDTISTIDALLHEEAPRPSALNPEISAGLDRVFQKLLRRDREERYQEAAQLAADLQRLKASSGQRWTLFGALATAGLACSALVLLLYRAQHVAVLTPKDTVVLADFVNTTGDPIFDRTLRQGLSVQLDQSPYLSLISDERIAQTLRLMKQPAQSRLTAELARGVCQRLASAAVLEGTIARLGNGYVIGFAAKACSSGESLDRQQIQVKRKEDVLNELSKIAAAFRAHAGESLASVRVHDAPLAEATTSSLEALKAYSTAWNIAPRVGPEEVIPLVQRAIALDGQFALAHAFLARLYGDIGEGELSEKSVRRAYELRERTTDSERFFIAVNYHQQATGDAEKAFEIAQIWARTYERDVRPHAFLSWLNQALGHYEKSVEEGKLAIALDPDFTPGYMNLTWAYIFLERPEEGRRVLDEAEKRKLYMPEMLVAHYSIAFVKNDEADMARLKAQTAGKSAGEGWMWQQQATVAAYAGHVQDANRLARNAIALALQAHDRERAGIYEVATAVRQALFGNGEAARREAEAALHLSSGRDVEWGAALAFAFSGEMRRAQDLGNELERRFPEDTCVRFTYLPTLRAIAALQRGRPAEAIELLQSASRFDLAISGSWSGFFGTMYPVYIRGLAYMAEGQSTEAAAEFQRVIDHPGSCLPTRQQPSHVCNWGGPE